jgi:anti-sigma factor ChrR (cupin superfamily)
VRNYPPRPQPPSFVNPSLPASSAPIIHLPDLLRLAENPDSLSWQPFREGVEIHRLYGDGLTGPSAALLRYQEASRIPRHTHEGYEHLLILGGSQRDEHGILPAGTLRIHPPGTSHEVFSDAGCLVLAIYEKPVRFEAD